MDEKAKFNLKLAKERLTVAKKLLGKKRKFCSHSCSTTHRNLKLAAEGRTETLFKKRT